MRIAQLVLPHIVAQLALAPAELLRRHRAGAMRWKDVCWRVGLARAAAHEHWLCALCFIAWRLNSGSGLARLGRRAAIARIRS